ncbi:hypothetical protein IG193_00385 [Infirmifilum lucidum]|uniref:Uncharacterized protein n=1 Tax=Infirmifilum lucidum TaxID=2776706 RepID=A0A7L9FGS7_9CREN|nr:hypothetical protein [Infirmifilum lucidum]QOJ78959.1 hypothetical protein IG193_00385 [Infirmifilum lucidum]
MDWYSLLALASGWAVGREVKRKEYIVSPTIVFVSPTTDVIDALSSRPKGVEDIVREAFKENMGREPTEEELRLVIKELEKRSQGPSDKTRKIYECLDKLRKIQEAFCNGKIDSGLYVWMRRRYVDKLVKLVTGEA